jgi:hypothetical protein
MEGLGDTLSRMARQQWEATKASPVGKFARYQLDPESFLAPNERLEPGLTDGYAYSLKPNETADDAGNVVGPDGQPVTFKPRPQLSTLADMLGYMTGGVGGAPKGALGAGAYRSVRDVNPSVFAGDDYARGYLATRMEAGHKRAGQGYQLPDMEPKTLSKMDKSLTSMSTEPSKPYLEKADRALSMGFDTPAYHFTNAPADPEMARLLGAAPFRELDPFVTTRGSMYFGDVPSKIIQSGAAQKTIGDPRMYPFILKDVMGEHAMPPGLFEHLPDTLKPNQWGELGGASKGDMIAGIKETPGYADNITAAREAAKEHFGSSFDPDFFANQQTSAREALADMLSKLYYDKQPGGLSVKSDPMGFVPAAINDPGLPHYSQYEVGARPNKPGTNMTGLHSPLQNEVGAVGFSGSRILDEMRNAGGKSFAMIDPTGVRSMGAKFLNPNGDLLSGTAPPSWLLNMPMTMPNEGNPQ